jgi:myo-inositol-1(or 4)-monophosphatase
MTMRAANQELCRTACDLARLAAAAVRPLLGQVRRDRKADDSPVTEADHLAQATILAELSRRYPDHAVLVEEVVQNPERHANVSRSEYCWVVDPIDGTRNFCRGVNMYAVSIGVLHQGRPVVGAVYDATRDGVFSAIVGEGARLDDQPLRLIDRAVSSDTTIALSSFRRRPVTPAVKAWMDRYLFRNVGAVALQLSWVAAGLIDATYSHECKLWDMAAAALIIAESGGMATRPDGGSLWPIEPTAYAGEDVPILAGTPTMHRQLLESLS